MRFVTLVANYLILVFKRQLRSRNRFRSQSKQLNSISTSLTLFPLAILLTGILRSILSHCLNLQKSMSRIQCCLSGLKLLQVEKTEYQAQMPNIIQGQRILPKNGNNELKYNVHPLHPNLLPKNPKQDQIKKTKFHRSSYHR